MGRSQGICGIELGKDALNIVHYLPDKDTVTSVAIQPLSDSALPWWDSVRVELKPTLRAAISDGRTLKGATAVCSLPAENAVVTRLMVDTNEPSPASILRWEMRHQVVGALEDYVFDFQKMAAVRPGPTVSYLASACRGAWAGKVRSLLRAHGLVPHVLDLDVFAIINAFEANYRDMMSTPAILVLGGEQITKIILTWNGNLVDYEQCKFSPDTQEPEEYVRQVKTAIERLQASYPSLASRGPIPMLASGSIFTWQAVAAACFHAFTQMQVLNPFRNIACTAVSESELRLHAPRLGVAVGLAVREASELDS
jgi:Tfp pilus assembly PilM family ATPase